MTFHKNAYLYIQLYLFVFAHSDVKYAEHKWRRSSLYHAQVTIPVNQSSFSNEFSPAPLVPFAVLGAPTEGY